MFIFFFSLFLPNPSAAKDQKTKTAEVDVLDDTQAMVTNLEASTEYGAQLVATNAHGTTTSEPTTFKTASTGTNRKNDRFMLELYS